MHLISHPSANSLYTPAPGPQPAWYRSIADPPACPPTSIPAFNTRCQVVPIDSQGSMKGRAPGRDGQDGQDGQTLAEWSEWAEWADGQSRGMPGGGAILCRTAWGRHGCLHERWRGDTGGLGQEHRRPGRAPTLQHAHPHTHLDTRLTLTTRLPTYCPSHCTTYTTDQRPGTHPGPKTQTQTRRPCYTLDNLGDCDYCAITPTDIPPAITTNCTTTLLHPPRRQPAAAPATRYHCHERWRLHDDTGIIGNACGSGSLDDSQPGIATPDHTTDTRPDTPSNAGRTAAAPRRTASSIITHLASSTRAPGLPSSQAPKLRHQASGTTAPCTSCTSFPTVPPSPSPSVPSPWPWDIP